MKQLHTLSQLIMSTVQLMTMIMINVQEISVFLKLSGNTELTPETSQSINLGIIFQPVEALAFNFDYFRTSRENVILFYNDSPSLDASLRDVTQIRNKKEEQKR